jgi:hypothetical protein
MRRFLTLLVVLVALFPRQLVAVPPLYPSYTWTDPSGVVVKNDFNQVAAEIQAIEGRRAGFGHFATRPTASTLLTNKLWIVDDCTNNTTCPAGTGTAGTRCLTRVNDAGTGWDVGPCDGAGGGSGTVTSVTCGTGMTCTPASIIATGSVALTAPVGVANGGTGLSTSTEDAVMVGSGTTAWQAKTLPLSTGAGQVLQYDTTANTFSAHTLVDADIPDILTLNLPSSTLTGIIADQLLVGTGAAVGAYKTLTVCTGASKALTYDTATHTFGCNTISGGSTNALLDGVNHTDTTAGTVARGDVITGQGATPKWTRLAKGTASQCLQMDGTATDVVWGACGGAGTTNALLDGVNHTDTAAGTVTRGDLISGQGATTKWTRLGANATTNNEFLRSTSSVSSGEPVWAFVGFGDVQTGSSSANLTVGTGGQINVSGGHIYAPWADLQQGTLSGAGLNYLIGAGTNLDTVAGTSGAILGMTLNAGSTALSGPRDLNVTQATNTASTIGVAQTAVAAGKTAHFVAQATGDGTVGITGTNSVSSWSQGIATGSGGHWTLSNSATQGTNNVLDCIPGSPPGCTLNVGVNVQGASAFLKPLSGGTIVANAIGNASAPVGTTTPLAQGDLLVADATPAFSRFGKGAANQCLQMDGTGTTLTWAACSTGGGTVAFNNITSGTPNTTATMQVGTGASLGPTGTGVVNANQLNGASCASGADCLTQYALLAGRTSGQTLAGGTATGDKLSLKGTTNGSPLSTSTVDIVNYARFDPGPSLSATDAAIIVAAPTSTITANYQEVELFRGVTTLGAGAVLRGISPVHYNGATGGAKFVFTGNPGALGSVEMFTEDADYWINTNAKIQTGPFTAYGDGRKFAVDATTGNSPYFNIKDGITHAVNEINTGGLIFATNGTASPTACAADSTCDTVNGPGDGRCNVGAGHCYLGHVAHMDAINWGTFAGYSADWLIDQFTGLWQRSPGGTGIVTKEVGVDLNLTQGGTRISMQSADGGTTMRHAGSVDIGSVNDPGNTRLVVTGTNTNNPEQTIDATGSITSDFSGISIWPAGLSAGAAATVKPFKAATMVTWTGDSNGISAGDDADLELQHTNGTSGGTRTLAGRTSIYAAPTFLANGTSTGKLNITDVATDAACGVNWSPSFTTSNSSTGNTAATVSGLHSKGSVAANWTVTKWAPIVIDNPSNSGAITTLVGIDIGNLTAGVTDLSIRSAGGMMEHAGPVRIGDTTAPTQQLEVLGNVLLDNAGTASELRFREPSASGATYTAFKAPVQAASVTYTLPVADGGAGDQLTTNGSGVMSWGKPAIQVALPAAACQGATATANWDLPTTEPARASCVTGTNIQKGVLLFEDGTTTTSESAQVNFPLSGDFTEGSGVIVALKWSSTDTNVAHATRWCVQIVCVADGSTDDPAFGTAVCVNDVTKATSLQMNDTSVNITGTGCAAASLMHLRVYRDAKNAADTVVGDSQLTSVLVTLNRT